MKSKNTMTARTWDPRQRILKSCSPPFGIARRYLGGGMRGVGLYRFALVSPRTLGTGLLVRVRPRLRLSETR